MKILIALYRFVCPFCDESISKGSNYVEKEGFRICLKCGLPARRLRPLKHT